MNSQHAPLPLADKGKTGDPIPPVEQRDFRLIDILITVALLAILAAALLPVLAHS